MSPTDSDELDIPTAHSMDPLAAVNGRNEMDWAEDLDTRNVVDSSRIGVKRIMPLRTQNSNVFQYFQFIPTHFQHSCSIEIHSIGARAHQVISLDFSTC